MSENCYSCGKDGKLLECSNCQSVVYCSQACQYDDWVTGHKYECHKFVGANGNTIDERRITRRSSRRRRVLLRERNKGVRSITTPIQERFQIKDERTGRILSVLATTNLSPGEYEIYHTKVRLSNVRFRLRGSEKIIMENIIIIETLVQTKNARGNNRNWIVFKPDFPPTVAGGEGPACVEIDCPPQFPSGTTCWRCIDVIAAPSTGEQGWGQRVQRSDRVVSAEDIPITEDDIDNTEAPRRRIPREDSPPRTRIPREDSPPRSNPGIVVTIPGLFKHHVSSGIGENTDVIDITEEQYENMNHAKNAIDQAFLG